MENTITVTLFRPFTFNSSPKAEERCARFRALNFKCIAPFGTIVECLEWIFAITNNPWNWEKFSEESFVFSVFYDARENGVMVGDVIQINDKFYLCEGCGWTEITDFSESYDLD